MKKFLLFLSIILLAGCSCKSNYHELAYDRKPTLGNDGLLIGIEKYNWNCVNKEKGVDLSRYKIDQPDTKSSKLFERLVNHKKSMIVSHILEFKNGVRNDIYNPFIAQNALDPEYERGYAELDKLTDKITSELQKGDYTHVIFMSMGWHNDQYESIDRYKKIITTIKRQDTQNTFKPYLVTVTWPSSWGSNSKFSVIEKLGHIISYLNKPQDADEIGFTIGNYLLHNVILNAVNKVNNTGAQVKTIGIGHSLGARLLSRSIFSKKYLKNDQSNGQLLDLFIGLEPAFSANRFIEDGGIEGSPYKNHSELQTKFLITTSKYDKANPVAFWSEHLGGKDSFNTVKKHTDDYNFYGTRIIEGKTVGLNLGNFWNSPKKIEYVNCDFIKDHNDILDNEMGIFLFDFINKSKI
jgi:hypothetical protein